jgi:hypothetical protein
MYVLGNFGNFSATIHHLVVMHCSGCIQHENCSSSCGNRSKELTWCAGGLLDVVYIGSVGAGCQERDRGAASHVLL